MRLAVLGRTHWLLDSARALLRAGHSITFVATAPAAPEYRATAEDFAKLAKEAGAAFFEDVDCNAPAFIQTLRKSGAEIGVSMNWPKLIGPETCAAVARGILNAHAGDLPRYRGNACPNWAILNGESHVGLCVHAMDPAEIDAGPIFARTSFALSADTHITEVYEWLSNAVPDLYVKAIANAANPSFTPEDQQASGARPLRCHPRRPEDGLIDWKASAENICRLVRASSRPFAGAFSFLDGARRVTVWRARLAALNQDLSAVPGQILGRGSGGGVLVATGAGVLELTETSLDEGRLPASNRYRLTNAR
ncbi:MAG TPA: formyltransferase family protein [Caulobacterales bacterium]|nr:formyltransferase family protein [Caulobacterales bacterium]